MNPWDAELALLRKKLWVYSAYTGRAKQRPEVKARLWEEVKEACREVAWEES